jgi:phosphocarrier protein
VVVIIKNRLGLHARPAMSFVDTASGFASSIVVRRVDQEETVDGKSIMDVMMLAATAGTGLEIVAEGDDSAAACEALRRLVESGFDEP